MTSRPMGTAATVDVGDDLPLTMAGLLRARAEEHGSAPFVVTDDEVLTYADAEARSELLARALLAAGVGRGTHVGLLAPNGPEFVVAWLAAIRIGAVAIPLSTFSTPHELAGLLAGADVEVLVSVRSYRSHRYEEKLHDAIPGFDPARPAPLLAPAVPTLRHIWFLDAAETTHRSWTVDHLLAGATLIDDDVLRAAEVAVSPADRMVIVHTSGSTSEPKGVIHTHGALIRHQDNLNRIRRYTPDEILFSNSPFFWIGGLAYALLATLVAGGRLVCSNAADAAGVLDLLEREHPTMVNGFAQSVAHLRDDPTFATRDLSSIRRGNLWPIMPSDVVPADVELRHSMLGMTETGSVCLVSEDESDLPEAQRGSYGRPAPGFDAQIVDLDTGGLCPVGTVGELWLRGPFLMEGYYGRERADTFTPDGWYRTGDLVVSDADGLFYFTGRSGDMIKTSGANVSPREVEAAIRSVADLESHVLGITDADRGQIVTAVLVIPDGRTFDADSVENLRSALASRLSAYKVPRRFVPMAKSDVPMMSSGKLDVRALRTALAHD